MTTGNREIVALSQNTLFFSRNFKITNLEVNIWWQAYLYAQLCLIYIYFHKKNCLRQDTIIQVVA